MTIGRVSKQSGFSSSTIRYYERAGVLPKPGRIGGKRRYDPSVLEQLAVVGHAKACGFSLTEVRRLFSGFCNEITPSERWQTLAGQKIAELDEMARKIVAMRELLKRPCACRDLGECGRRIFAKKQADVPRL